MKEEDLGDLAYKQMVESGRRTRVRQQLDQMLQQITQKKVIIMVNQVQEQQTLTQVLDIYKELPELLSLKLYWNQMPNIPKLLSHHHYQKLCGLFLGGNKIVSLEGLTNMRVPMLQILSLWNNHLTNIDSLRKMDLPNLKSLELSQNLLNEAPEIGTWNIKVTYLNVQNNRLSHLTPLATHLMRVPQTRIFLHQRSLIHIFGHQNRTNRINYAKMYRHSTRRVEPF